MGAPTLVVVVVAAAAKRLTGDIEVADLALCVRPLAFALCLATSVAFLSATTLAHRFSTFAGQCNIDLLLDLLLDELLSLPLPHRWFFPFRPVQWRTVMN